MNQKYVPSLDLHTKEPDDSIVYLLLPDLVQVSHRLILHKKRRILSLISYDDSEPNSFQQEILSGNELQIITPIFNAFPYYCPYEVLLASIFSRTTRESAVIEWQLRLQDAHSKGTWQKEIRPLRRVLTSLRRKMRSFGLEISTVREKGCSITSLDLRREN